MQPSTPRRSPRPLALAAASLLCAGPASASPLFELVGDTDGTGGFNARADTASAASTYFNPALLPEAERGLDLGVFFVDDQIDIDVDARASSPLCQAGACDVPEVLGGGPESFRHADGTPLADPTVPTKWLNEGRPPSRLDEGLAARPRQGADSSHNLQAYQVLGLVSPIFGERLVLGFYGMIPLSEFTAARSFYNDEREQFFSNSLHPELYADRLNATSLALGVGSRVSSVLSLGVSFTLNLANSAAVPVYVSNLSQLDTLRLDANVGVQISAAPHFGVVFDPLRRLRLSATVHTPEKFDIDTGFTYFISTGTEQGTTVSFTHAYLPVRVALGGRLGLGEAGGHDLSLVASAIYGRWSDYVDRHSESAAPGYEWADTVTTSLGVRDRIGPTQLYLDLLDQPSPVPEQTGRSNYVDNHRIAIDAGLDHRFRLWGSTFKVGLQVQLHDLLSRHATKIAGQLRDEVPDDAIDGQLGDPIPGRDGLQTNNPGFPGFGSSGFIFGAGAHIAVLY